MGSVFLVIIPTRSHEFHLRLAENEIYALPATPIDPRGKVHTHNSLLNLLKLERAKAELDLTGDGPARQKAKDEVIAWDIDLPMTRDVVQAYLFDHNGKLLLELSYDGMKLTHAGKVGTMGSIGSGPLPGRLKNRSDGSVETPEIKIEPTTSKWKILGRTAAATSASSITLGVPRAPGRRKMSSFVYRLPDAAEKVELTEVIDTNFLEKVIKIMEDSLHEYELLHATWEQTVDGKFTQILFTVKTEISDEIINHLHDVGIGKKYHSTLSVMSASIFTQETNWRKSQDSLEFDDQWESFVQSIKGRLTVAQVAQNVKADARVTFDFTMMVVVAAVIASIGLLGNSSVNIIASMLLSPLINPIIAVTFGALIRDKALVKVGLRSGFLSFLICLVVGFILGFIAEVKLWTGPWSKAQIWPTPEMEHRGDVKSLILGGGIAITSGAGIALSILSGHAASLVGVAISSSLLPPCVNSGLHYGFSLAIVFTHGGGSLGCGEYVGGLPPEDPRIDLWRKHEKIYCVNAIREFAVMGTVSLCLALQNSVLIFLTGLCILKIKEVVPFAAKEAVARFWREDVKTARNYYKTHGENTLLDNIVDTRGVLKHIDEDTVWNHVKNRYPNDNVLKKLKLQKKRKHGHEQKVRENSVDGGWMSWFGRIAGKGGHK